MVRRGEGADAHLRRVAGERVGDDGVEVGKPRDEPRGNVADEVAEEIVRDDELAVHVGTGANAVHRHADLIAHERGALGRHRLEEDREGAGVLERAGIVEDLSGGGIGAALHAVPAQLPERLRRESEMAHHGNAGVGDGAHARRDPPSTLELHGVTPGRDERAGIPDRVLV